VGINASGEKVRLELLLAAQAVSLKEEENNESN
jgi:hypothetical protein